VFLNANIISKTKNRFHAAFLFALTEFCPQLHGKALVPVRSISVAVEEPTSQVAVRMRR
jgi:hypothetical protein